MRADAAVLEEREEYLPNKTPLMYALARDKPAIALWLIQHRGQHHVKTADINGMTALHWASTNGLLGTVKTLVAAGANPAVVNAWATRH